NHLIAEATKTLFVQYFPKIEKLKKQNQETPYDEIINWFFEADAFELTDESNEETYVKALLSVEPLVILLNKYQPKVATIDVPFLMEFVLWALVEFKQLSKHRTAGGTAFNDSFNNYIKGL
ncbi:MAG: magnesium chelatase, partial [Flavobacteriales bacterium]